MVKRLLTVAELAEMLHLSRWTIYELVRGGKLPVVRLVPGKMLFEEAAVEAAIRAATQCAPSQETTAVAT